MSTKKKATSAPAKEAVTQPPANRMVTGFVNRQPIMEDRAYAAGESIQLPEARAKALAKGGLIRLGE